MRKKLFILMLLAGLLPSNVFAETMSLTGGSLFGYVTGNISADGDLSLGTASTYLHLRIDDINLGHLSGASQAIATGGFTALGDGIVRLESSATFYYSTHIGDPWRNGGHVWDLFPGDLMAEGLGLFSSTLISPSQTITRVLNLGYESYAHWLDDFDAVFVGLPPVTLTFQDGGARFMDSGDTCNRNGIRTHS